jgi:hypothetical protein
VDVLRQARFAGSKEILTVDISQHSDPSWPLGSTPFVITASESFASWSLNGHISPIIIEDGGLRDRL